MRAFLAALILCAVASLPTPTPAQTAAERAACKPDAKRFCSAGAMLAAMLGDRQYIYACFKDHRHKLSKPCDRVLKSHGY